MTFFEFSIWCLVLCLALSAASFLLELAKTSPLVRVHSWAEVGAERSVGLMVMASAACGALAVLSVCAGLIQIPLSVP